MAVRFGSDFGSFCGGRRRTHRVEDKGLILIQLESTLTCQAEVRSLPLINDYLASLQCNGT